MYIIYFMFVATHETKTFYLLLQDNSRVAIETCHIALQIINPLLWPHWWDVCPKFPRTCMSLTIQTVLIWRKYQQMQYFRAHSII